MEKWEIFGVKKLVQEKYPFQICTPYSEWSTFSKFKHFTEQVLFYLTFGTNNSISISCTFRKFDHRQIRNYLFRHLISSFGKFPVELKRLDSFHFHFRDFSRLLSEIRNCCENGFIKN